MQELREVEVGLAGVVGQKAVDLVVKEEQEWKVLVMGVEVGVSG